MTFVIFTETDGAEVIVNAAHVVAVETIENIGGGPECRLWLTTIIRTDAEMDGGDDCVDVRGTLTSIHGSLNSATPQLHPSMLMPTAPAPWAPKTEASRD